MTQIPASYFDGKTSRVHRVTLSVTEGIARISGDAERAAPIAELRVSERTRNGFRKVTFPDDAYLEINDASEFDALLAETGYRDSAVVRMQQSWRSAFIGLIATIAILVLGYLYALPIAANLVAKAIPESVERSISTGTLEFLDKRILAPSQLPAARREAINKHFQMMVPPKDGAPSYEIIFRKSKIGPNAFALPSGQIIMTDELVKLMDNDEQVMGVLAHELGHLHERHLMRRIVQSSAIGAVVTVIFGDVSSIIVTVPTLMLDMKYSRDAEREADDYAIAMMKANGIPLSQLSASFERMKTKEGEAPPPYLSSHPSTDERIAHIQNAR
ncbi:M48 family metallopeptidase [Herminiimonas fonticola]|uniref:Peptidase M48-like protein n=1 Tax=Herminiimonas fonticola TaxID=303380 RepID=A0A4R6G7Z2_9BURK|nr:M48 family metallopeptidase [Herminiimonas fonticola]RBA23895.1 Peptidase family M48 [Herminiimonas fonticola]TDN89895.1 peptidase M48-like protein [Herminiimonas fonticola]